MSSQSDVEAELARLKAGAQPQAIEPGQDGGRRAATEGEPHQPSEGGQCVIVRILGEGQFDVPEDALTRLNALDAAVEAAVEAGDEAAFTSALAALLDGVRTSGCAHRAERARRVRPDPAALRRHDRRGPRPARRRGPDPGLSLLAGRA